MDKAEFQRVVNMMRNATDFTDLTINGTPDVRADFIAGLRKFDPKLADVVQKTIDARAEMIDYVRTKT